MWLIKSWGVKTPESLSGGDVPLGTTSKALALSFGVVALTTAAGYITIGTGVNNIELGVVFSDPSAVLYLRYNSTAAWTAAASTTAFDKFIIAWSPVIQLGVTDDCAEIAYILSAGTATLIQIQSIE